MLSYLYVAYYVAHRQCPSRPFQPIFLINLWYQHIRMTPLIMFAQTD